MEFSPKRRLAHHGTYPAGKLVLMLRMYWPDEDAPSILDGTWAPPPVKRIDLAMGSSTPPEPASK
jgi:hypothetical protein